MPSIIHDEHGTMEMPLRLVVYVIISAATIALVAAGIQYLKPGMTSNIMEKQIGEIGVSLNTMQYGAARNLIDPSSPDGNIRTFKITLPEDVEYLAFGVDPDPDNDDNLTDTKKDLSTERGNFILYKSRTGGKRKSPLKEDVEIREGILENGRWLMNKAEGKQYGVVLMGKGKSEMTFELVYDPVSRQKYMLAHFTDNLNAYINPYNPAIIPDSLWVSVSPDFIYSDGVTEGNIIIQLKDRNGRDAAKDRVGITLTTTLGNLSYTNLTTTKGGAASGITSEIPGTALIVASSPGLNSGSTYLTIKPRPIVLEFDQLLPTNEPQSRQFNTSRDMNYSVLFLGSGTEFWGWPVVRIEIDGMLVGEETIDSAYLVEKNFPSATLPEGTHTLSIGMTNDLNIPLIGGDRNLYVKRVILSE